MRHLPECLRAPGSAHPVARGRLSGSARAAGPRRTTGTNVWIDTLASVSGPGADLRALATAVEQQAQRSRS